MPPRYEFDEARLALTTGIASTYADLASLYARRDSLESALDIRIADGRSSSTHRVEIGLDTLAEQKQAEARVSQARADIEETDEAIALTKNALAALVGAGPDRALTIGRPDARRASRRKASPPTRRSTSSGAGRTSPRRAPASKPPRSASRKRAPPSIPTSI